MIKLRRRYPVGEYMAVGIQMQREDKEFLMQLGGGKMTRGITTLIDTFKD